MIDTHCHLTSKAFQDRTHDVIEAARAAGVTGIISVATDMQDAAAAIGLASQHPDIFATVGVHPHEAEHFQDKQHLHDAMLPLLAKTGVVAAGEMGLDTFYDDPPMDMQKRTFNWQLEIVKKYRDTTGNDLPIVIHNRQATDDALFMLRDSGIPADRIVFHCFTGTPTELEAILTFGAMVSITGIVTFKNSRELAEASDTIPLDRLMIETDSPYLTPEPHRKVRPNEPRYVPAVAAFLAQRRNMSLQAFTQAVDANAHRFFMGMNAPQA